MNKWTKQDSLNRKDILDNVWDSIEWSIERSKDVEDAINSIIYRPPKSLIEDAIIEALSE